MKNSLRHSKRAGTALVEATLTLGLYTAIIFSLWDFGYVMFLHQTLASRAENAARYGALNPADTAGMQNMVLYNSNSGSGAGIFGLTNSNVIATRSGSGTPADRVTVTVTQFKYLLISPGVSGTGKDISATMPVEN